MNIHHAHATSGNMALVRLVRTNEQLPIDSSEVVRKYESFSHVLSISDNETLNNINKIDMLKNYIPWVPSNVHGVSMQQYNDWVSNTSNNCAHYNLSCHSHRYRNKKIKIIIELLTFIKSIPFAVQHEFHFSNIQPHHIALFMERSFIPHHGKEDPNVDLNHTETTIIDKYIISNSSVRTAIGAISSFLSANYGREDHWSIRNTHGNPCKSRRIKDLYSNVVKVNDKRGVKIVHATPITAKILIKMIDAFDVYNNTLKKNYNSKEPKARTLAELLEILLIERDVCFYIYLFISLQRGGDATKLTTDNIVFGSSKQTDEIDYVDFTIYPHQLKKQTFEDKPKIAFTINRNYNWHVKDGKYQNGMPDKYCFIHRYIQFQQLCLEHGYNKNNMISIFPSSKNKRLDFSKNQDYQSAAKKFRANLKKIHSLNIYDVTIYNLTLHSFRRGGIQHRHLNGESQESVMKQAGHASKEMNKLYNDNRNLRGEKTVKLNDESIKELNDTENEDENKNEEIYDDVYDDDEDDEEDIHCVICKKGDNAEEMLICECCERGFHLKCLKLLKIPEDEEWYCKDCHAEPCSEIVKGFESHVGRLIQYETPEGNWQHACIETYDYKTKKHTLAIGNFKNYEQAIKKIEQVRKVYNFDVNESFQNKRLKFTDTKRWNN